MASKSKGGWRLTEQWTAQRPTTAEDAEAADVSRSKDGDTYAFERLYRRHAGRIHALAARMAGPDNADDLTQDVFVRAWERLSSFRGESQFGTWLHRLAVNLIIASRRAGGSRQRIDNSDVVLDGLSVEPVDTPFGVDFAAAIQRVPRAAREVFVLHDIEGYKHREIGRIAGISTGTSKGQLHRARAILRRYLK